MEEKIQRGGKREGAGRKPSKDPKSGITVFVPRSKILLFGSIEKTKGAILDFLEKHPVGENKSKEADLAIPMAEYAQPKERAAVRLKSVEEWIKEKREIELPELYEDFIDRLNADTTLTTKQKSLIKYA